MQAAQRRADEADERLRALLVQVEAAEQEVSAAQDALWTALTAPATLTAIEAQE